MLQIPVVEHIQSLGSRNTIILRNILTIVLPVAVPPSLWSYSGTTSAPSVGVEGGQWVPALPQMSKVTCNCQIKVVELSQSGKYKKNEC